MKKLFIAAVVLISSISAHCATVTIRYDLTAMLDSEILNFIGVPGDEIWMAAREACENTAKCTANEMNKVIAARDLALPIVDNYMVNRSFEHLSHQCPNGVGCIDVYIVEQSRLVVKVISYCPGACVVRSLTSFKN